MSREQFINIFDSAFINLVTQKWLEEYNLGYTACLLNVALHNRIITFHEYNFLSIARTTVYKERKKADEK